MKNLKKVSKKIMTLFMLMLSVMMSVPNVFAETQASASTVDKKGVIAISGIDQTKLSDITISAYKLMTTNIKPTVDADGNPAWQPAEPVYSWVPAVATWLRNHNTYKKYVNNKGEVTPAFTACPVSNSDDNTEDGGNTTPATTDCLNATDAQAFYDELASAIKTLNITPSVYTNDGRDITVGETTVATTAWTEANGSTVISGLDMGNYLVLIENGVNIYAPSAINVVPTKAEGSNVWTAGDTKLTVKYTTPSIEKEIVGDTQGEIGKVINYRVTADVPQYPEKATAKRVEISDKFTGLTFNEDSVVVKVDGQVITTGYTLDTTATDDYDFKIVFDYDVALKDHEEIVVEYSGAINASAYVTTGNTNKATLSYDSNPYNTDSFIPGDDDTVKAYTYGLKVTKIKEGNEDIKLAGAKFSVYTSEDSDMPMTFVKISDGVYRKAEAGEAGVTELEVGPEGATNKGILELRGLAAGATYYFEETEAPEGYVKLQRRVDITITTDTLDDEENTPNDGILDNDTDGFADASISNSDDLPVLPVTGGIGTILFSVIGIVFMGLGAFLIKNIFKKEDAE